MAPKNSSTRERLIDEDEEVLQAVILADSFNKRFRPLTTSRPRCLLPICNAPLLDWTFESLALAGVHEVFVVCRSHTAQVKQAISNSKWSKPGSGMKVVPIMTAKETFSIGDAMRDIYTRGFLTNDFVLVMGDLVSNIRIDEVVKVHKERRKANKDAIMTMVVKESGVKHRTRIQPDSAVFVLDPETSECLYYEPVTGQPPTVLAQLPREILEEHPDVEIRNDLIDCSIDVCSIEVPSLFQDNFDYSDIRRDFVHGILTSDLLIKNIHCYIAKEGYAARVKDTKSYDSVSKDILSRWAFPLVPDANHPGSHVYEQLRGNKYLPKDNSVALARTCRIGNNTLIGAASRLGENVQVQASVIGQNCIIGAGTVIRNSYILEGTVIGVNCTIELSIIGAEVDIGDKTYVPRGCLIGDGVTLGPGVSLEPHDRLFKRREATSERRVEESEEEADEDDPELDAVEAEFDPRAKFLGPNSNAIPWPNRPPEEDDEEDVENYRNQLFMRISDDSWKATYLDGDASSSGSEPSDDKDEDSDLHLGSHSAASSTTSLPLRAPTLPSTDALAESEFRSEVTQSLDRAFAEGHSVENAAVELKTLRMASNVPLSKVREAVISALVERIPIIPAGGKAQQDAISGVISRWGALIDKIGGVNPVETVALLQAHCAGSERLHLFGRILAVLYWNDIVEEDDIRAWHALPSSQGEGGRPGPETENFKKCWASGAEIIKRLDEQESDESEEE
ncbi:hypothetical protein AX16_003610 [Volvariella volvacea WC 439]|nr:hypothetical protein AX16_003610 [Volvariella volvacea WC 439]